MTRSSDKQKLRHTARVASHIPGRLRVKLHRGERPFEFMDRLKQHIEAQKGIHEVNLNQTTGSVTVKYDHQRLKGEEIFDMLKDADVALETVMKAADVGQAATELDKPETMVTFIGAIDDLNNRLSKIAGVGINLKIILPFAFVGAGLWSISKKGLMLEAIPGWVFLWLAFDTFVKLHPHHAPSHPSS